MNQVTTLFLSLNLLTTLSFESEVISFMYGGSEQDVYFKVTNNRNTLAIKPKIEGTLSNLLVITKQRKYYFDLSHSVNNPHQFVEVKHGVINHAMKKLVTKPDYEILQGDSSILYINRGRPKVINGKQVKTKDYFSKGVPLIVNGNRALN
jgi:hypothetical protein